MNQIKVGLAGLGFMGQVHFGCYGNNPNARVVAVCDSNASKLTGQTAIEGNIEGAAPLDLFGLRATSNFQYLLDDPEIELIDLCLPTPQHARAAIAALEAGKHVMCEKPMAATLAECDAMIAAAERSGKNLMIGHCLRFWPCYVAAHEIIGRGELGRVLYARFHRSTAAPKWSRWMLDGAQSGGAIFDTHIHDVDTALWWFGAPNSIQTRGLSRQGLSLKVDANWEYENGLQLDFHCGWDLNGGPFRMSFEVTGEAATLAYDSALGESLQWHQGGQTRAIEVAPGAGYQAEIDCLIECIGLGQNPTRATPQSSREAVRVTLQEMNIIAAQRS